MNNTLHARFLTALLAFLATCIGATGPARAAEPSRPNVIIVMTDDQGYGDCGFSGNDSVRTPAIDKLRTQGTLLNNFHVDPTCAPTRAALMTGRYSARTGVWHTIQGRNMLRAE